MAFFFAANSDDLNRELGGDRTSAARKDRGHISDGQAKHGLDCNNRMAIRRWLFLY